MKILFLTRLFYPHIGGVEKHVWEIGKILISKGYSITVVTEQYDKNLKEHEEINGFEVFRIPASGDDWFKKFRIWKWLWNHKSLIKIADIVHCHDVFYWYLPFRILYPGKSVFATFHGHEGIFPPNWNAIVVRKLSEELSKGNISIGHFIIKWYGTKPTFITYGGISKSRNTPQIKKHYRNVEILFIGRLENDIGIMKYLKTIDLLSKRKVKVDFKVVGEGKLREIVEVYGNVYGFKENISAEIDKADILFCSSYLTILQGLSMKRLVFAVYDNPLKEDYLRMTPFAKYIVIAGSAEELAEKVLYYLKHPKEEKKLVDAGYQWVKTQTWDKVADLYEKLWKI